MARVIVFDAGVLIAYLETADAFHGSAVGFLEEQEEFEFVVSPLTLSECLVRPAARGQSQLVISVLERLRFEHSSIAWDDAVGVAELRALTGLKMPDAVVLYTAVRHEAELVTTDKALAEAAESRGVTAHLLGA